MGRQRRPLQLQLVAMNFALVRIFDTHSKRNSAARGELRRHDRFTGCAGLHKIIEDAIRDRFVERALVSIRREIEFERLTFDAEMVGHVIDIDPSKIGLACDRADRGEIICFKVNPVIPVRRRIWKYFEPRLRGGCRNSSFTVSEKR